MNENKTCKQLVEPPLETNGWSWKRHLRLGPARIMISDGSMYEYKQESTLDHLFPFGQIALAVLEIEPELKSAVDVIR